ncbi:hypothetical protein EI94DRAFT_1802156 [Lactarius quietus]|nr:hypothetical protein EI94DRAFT_1802156 [Lactarius quietus]
MSYPARRPLNSTVRQVLPEHFRFRILIVGKSRSGKTSLVKTIFKVDISAAPEKADINVEFRPEDNRYLTVHEFSGLDSQARDSGDLQIIQDFISRRTDPNRTPSERLHAVWVCVPTSDAIDGRVGGGIEGILGLRNVPVVLVFTKFDVVVSQVLFDIGGDAQHYERARTRAYTMFEDSCRRLFRRDPRDVPAEIVSEKSRFLDLIDNLIVTTDSFITNARHPLPGLDEVVSDVHTMIWVASKIPVVLGYWRSLWSSLDFADQTLKNCVKIIHDDIVEIWNMNDRNRYLSSDRFKVKMSHLVKDLAGSTKPWLPSSSGPTRDDYADWVNDLYRGSQENVRCVVGYIVDLTVILDGVFRTAAGNMSAKDANQVLERHVRSGHKDAIHRDIQSFITEAFAIRFSVPQKDLILERIIDLIKQFCVPP